MKLFCLRFILGLVTLILANSIQGHSQPITMQQTLDYIRQKLGSDIEIEVVGGYLSARFHEGGAIYREDQVKCADLNITTIQYDKEARLLVIECGAKADCVDRQLVVRKIDRQYGRISFPVDLDAKSAEGMKNAFAHMIRLVQNPKYKSETPFEQ
jgi:uncharacterized membrane protein